MFPLCAPVNVTFSVWVSVFRSLFFNRIASITSRPTSFNVSAIRSSGISRSNYFTKVILSMSFIPWTKRDTYNLVVVWPLVARTAVKAFKRRLDELTSLAYNVNIPERFISMSWIRMSFKRFWWGRCPASYLTLLPAESVGYWWCWLADFVDRWRFFDRDRLIFYLTIYYFCRE